MNLKHLWCQEKLTCQNDFGKTSSLNGADYSHTLNILNGYLIDSNQIEWNNWNSIVLSSLRLSYPRKIRNSRYLINPIFIQMNIILPFNNNWSNPLLWNWSYSVYKRMLFNVKSQKRFPYTSFIHTHTHSLTWAHIKR